MLDKKNYNSLDMLKFFLSILVIILHVHPFENVSSLFDMIISNGVCRIAVPCFFIISGYLLSYKISGKIDKKEYIKSYILRLLKLYLIWTLIYLPFVIYDLLINDKSIYMDTIILLRNLIFSSVCDHLWYIKSLIIAILLICVMRKLNFGTKKYFLFQ